ncbi:hypothetical protein LSO9J_20031 [Candidatus Liberibacter solanacearum]
MNFYTLVIITTLIDNINLPKIHRNGNKTNFSYVILDHYIKPTNKKFILPDLIFALQNDLKLKNEV